jgi:hypothetical protein
VLLNEKTIESGLAKYYFVTWATPESWTEGSGRQCKVAIGATVFVWRNQGWNVESSNRFMASAGTYGYPPEPVKFMQIGTNKHGVLMETSDLTQGYEWTSVDMISPVGRDFRIVWSEGVSANNGGACSPDEKERMQYQMEKCYESSASYRFVHKNNAQYFDIRVVSSGTAMSPKGKVVPENWEKSYRFTNGKYREFRKVSTPPAKKVAGREAQPR